MKFNKVSRRMFLQGSGKLAVMMPFLGSLLPKSAKAASEVKPRFIFMSCQNGGQRDDMWFPSQAPMTPTFLYPAQNNGIYSTPVHNYHTGGINFTSNNGISPIFDNKFISLIPKMNFIKGLDQRFNPFGNHDGSALLGNVGAAHGSVSFCPQIPTIDQLMANSEGFYPNQGNGYVRSLSLNSRVSGASRRITGYYFSNPYKRTGNIVYVPNIMSAHNMFKVLFDNTSAVTVGQSNTTMVDEVLADYKKVRNSRELASSEKLILDEYIDKLAQLEIKLNTDVVPKIPQCQNLTAPSVNGWTEKQNLDLMIEMMVLAFQCDRTRVATMHFNEVNGKGDGSSEATGDWHWASHNPTDPLGRQVLLDVYKWVADNALYPLVSKMNSVIEPNGLTMLDNSIVHFATSSANIGHNPKDLPTLLFGSAGGFFKTGNYIDYVNRGTKFFTQNAEYGILHNQYLTNIMTAMGLKKSDWNMSSLGFSKNGFPTNADGYGWYTPIDGEFAGGRNPRYKQSESQTTNPLPGLITPLGLSKFV